MLANNTHTQNQTKPSGHKSFFFKLNAPATAQWCNLSVVKKIIIIYYKIIEIMKERFRAFFRNYFYKSTIYLSFVSCT